MSLLQVPAISPELVEFARRLLGERMRRTEFFGAELFAEPAWNIMLDLFVARAGGMRVSVSDATVASGAPHATATRWLQRMAASGLVARTIDQNDGRRVFVELTPMATAKMVAYLQSMASRDR